MTLEEVRSLYEYWMEEPPVHDLVRWYVGYKYSSPHKPREADVKEVAVIQSATKGVVKSFDQLPPFVQQMLWEEHEKSKLKQN